MKLHAPNKENHRALWMWLAGHPEEEKENWPGFETMRRYGIEHPECDCFLCAEGFNCLFDCPLSGCLESDNPYRLWSANINRRANALKIANCWR